MVVDEEFGVVFMVRRKDRRGCAGCQISFAGPPCPSLWASTGAFLAISNHSHSQGSFQKKKKIILKGIVLGNQWCKINAVAKWVQWRWPWQFKSKNIYNSHSVSRPATHIGTMTAYQEALLLRCYQGLSRDCFHNQNQTRHVWANNYKQVKNYSGPDEYMSSPRSGAT